MQLTMLKGYPDFVGKRATFCGFGNGPASYVQMTPATAPAAATGGDPVTLPMPNYYIDILANGVSVSGTYTIRAFSSGVGPRQKWFAAWFLTSTGAQPTAGTNLSAEQVQLGGLCGQY